MFLSKGIFLGAKYVYLNLKITRYKQIHGNITWYPLNMYNFCVN